MRDVSMLTEAERCANSEVIRQPDSAPLQADSTPREADSGITKWDVWIENAEGGYAVKGSAETVAAGYVNPPPKSTVRFVTGTTRQHPSS